MGQSWIGSCRYDLDIHLHISSPNNDVLELVVFPGISRALNHSQCGIVLIKNGEINPISSKQIDTRIRRI